MLVLELHLLTDRYAATAYNDRRRTEWPPHPARVYSALVDALHAADSPNTAQGAALDALAEFGAPEVLASGGHPRRVMTHFVPVNDVAVTDRATLVNREAAVRAAREGVAKLDTAANLRDRKRAQARLSKAVDRFRAEAIKRAAFDGAVPKKPSDNPAPKVIPGGRTKQPRTFPAFVPRCPRVDLVWPEAALEAEPLAALNEVASRVVRIGHSSSFVRLHARSGDDVAPAPQGRTRWLPNGSGDKVLRVPMTGQRAALEAAFARDSGDLPGRVMPAAYVAYAPDQTEEPLGRTPWTGGRWIVYALAPEALPPASAAVAVADAVRRSLLSYATKPISSMLSGRTEDGVLAAPHLAVVPLPFVGHRYADGALRGFALSLPADCEDDRSLLSALGRWEQTIDPNERRLKLSFGDLTLHANRVVDPHEALRTLQRGRWASLGTRSWATVTPIALDGHCGAFNHPSPGARRKARNTAAKLIRKAVLHAVRPPDGVSLRAKDIEVELIFDVATPGAPHLRRVPVFRRPGHPSPRRLVHALLRLPFPVRGPLLLGAGRHHGLGLCAPLNDEELR